LLVVQPFVNRIADCAVVLEHKRGSSAEGECRRIPILGVDGNSPSPLEELGDDLELEPAVRTHAVYGVEGVSLDGHARLESQGSRMGRSSHSLKTRSGGAVPPAIGSCGVRGSSGANAAESKCLDQRVAVSPVICWNEVRISRDE